MNSTRRGRQTTGSGAYRGSQGSQPSATDYTESLAPASSHNKWQGWSNSQKILDTRTCSPAHVRGHALAHAHAAWLQHLAPAWNLVFALNPHCDLSSYHPPFSFCLHLFYIWGPHYVKFLHPLNTFNLLPAKFRVTFSDFFLLLVLLVLIFYCTLSTYPILRLLGREEGLKWRDLDLKENQERITGPELTRWSLSLTIWC